MKARVQYLSLIILVITAQLFGSNLQEKIIYSTDQSGVWDIWMMNPDGTNQKPVITSDYSDQLPSLSHDGKTMVFRRYDPNASEYSLIRYDFITKSETVVFQQSDPIGPSLSFFPNDSVVLYGVATPSEEIYATNIYDGTTKNLTNNPDMNDFACVMKDSVIIFSRDTNGSGCAMCVELFSMDYEGNNQTRITNLNGRDWATDILKDSLILFNHKLIDQDNHMYLHNLSDGINTDLGFGINPVWSIDGNQIAYILNSEIWEMQNDGTSPVQITNIGHGIGNIY